MSKKVENWKKAIYSKSENLDNPAGDIFRELSDSELDGIMAGGTANTYCRLFHHRIEYILWKRVILLTAENMMNCVIKIWNVGNFFKHNDDCMIDKNKG